MTFTQISDSIPSTTKLEQQEMGKAVQVNSGLSVDYLFKQSSFMIVSIMKGNAELITMP